MSKSNGGIFGHSAYSFDAQGRIIQSKYQYLTETHVYTNQYTNDGILMLFGKNATDPNGSRIALKFAGGNRVEEKTIILNYPTTVKIQIRLQHQSLLNILESTRQESINH